MKRHPAVDPPEYLRWNADPALVRAFAELVQADADRQAIIKSLDRDALLRLYEGLLRFRLHDYTLKRWVKRGVISKAWLGTGEEAVTIGAVHALERGSDFVAPMIRNQGALHEFGMKLESLFAGYLGSDQSPNGGKDGHIGDLSKGVVPPISHVGEMVPVATGIALAFKQRKEKRVALTWVGDGSSKTGAVHEGLNLAAVLRVPAIFILQNNQVALGTKLSQHQVGDFRQWASMYGMRGATADGNNVLDVYAAVRQAADHARNGGGATFLVIDTFRMGGHATHDEAEARVTFDPSLFEFWGQRDPIGLYEEYLVSTGVDRASLESIEERVEAEVEAAAENALLARESMPLPETAELPGVSAGVRQAGHAHRL
ncbi:MAG: thiamine pyrophosphate-dependent dehydrogenase E1 component subunit alpha [Longimicrobiales bacterium]